MKNRNNPADAVKVYFPCIHAGSTGDILSITCFKSEELKGIVKVVLGIDDEAARTIIGAGRHGERGPEVGKGVMMLFSNPLFSGRSYGLSMVVADKLARYRKITAATKIYATGEIPVDGCGRVDPVDGFTEKLHLLKTTLSPGSLLILPQANVANSEQNRAIIKQLTDLGVECIDIAHVDELERVVWQAKPPLLPADKLQKLKTILVDPTTLKSAAVIFSVFLFSALLYLILEKTAPPAISPDKHPVIPEIHQDSSQDTKTLLELKQQNRTQSTHQKAANEITAAPAEETSFHLHNENAKSYKTVPTLESVEGNPQNY